jgi:hypothetical protein
MAKCLIWDTPAEAKPRLGGGHVHMVSPRAGGEYKVTGSVVDKVSELTVNEKKVLTTWLVSQHRAGITLPVIDSYNIDEILKRRRLPYTERANRALLFMGDRTNVGGTLAVDNSEQNRERNNAFLAITECTDVGEAQVLMKMMAQQGLLLENQETLFSITPEGWSRYEELEKTAINSSQAFVAMWFHSSTEEPYKNGLYQAIYDSGYDARRVDQEHHHINKVDDEIIAEIRRSRFIVVDCTCEKEKVRGSVYFEAGFAYGLDVPIIWTCRDTSLTDLQFDTRQYPHIVWTDSADLYKKLKARIGALIGDGPKRRS